MFMLQTDSDFRMKLNYTEAEVEEMVRSEGPEAVVSISVATLTGMTMENMAAGKNPTFEIQYKYIIGKGHASFGIPLTDMADTFENFWTKYLKKLF